MSFAPKDSLVIANEIGDGYHIGLYINPVSTFIALVWKNDDGSYRSNIVAEATEQVVSGFGGYDNFRDYVLRKFRTMLANREHREPTPHEQEMADLIASFTLDELRQSSP